MGLDVVEIVLRVEETFGVDLPDAELESAATVGDLYKLLLSKLDGSYACLSSRAFYRVRRSMVEVFGVSRGSIRPSTELQPLIGRHKSVEKWKRIEGLAGLRFPRLEHPRWFHGTALVVSAAMYLSMCALVMPVYFAGGLAPMSGLRAIGFPFAVGVIFIPIAMALMRSATPFLAYVAPAPTVGGLAKTVLTNNYAELAQGAVQSKKRDDAEVWLVLKEIIVDQLQIEPDEVTPEAHFGRDLGCD
jgi:acyl carrier protein